MVFGEFGKMIEEKSLFRINYGDFYKFTISSSIIVFVISIFIFVYLVYIRSIILVQIICFLFAIFSVVGIIWAIKKWKINQDKVDKLMNFELSIKKIESRERYIEFLNKNKEYSKWVEKEKEAQKKMIETLSGAAIMKKSNVINSFLVNRNE